MLLNRNELFLRGIFVFCVAVMGIVSGHAWGAEDHLQAPGVELKTTGTNSCQFKKNELRKLAEGNAKASRAAKKMEERYEELSKRLSPEVQNKLCLSENSYINFMVDGTRFIQSFKREFPHKELPSRIWPFSDPVSESLINNYSDDKSRNSVWATNAEGAVGDLNFLILGFYKALPLRKSDIDSYLFQERMTTFPQIVHPKNKSEVLFNMAIESYPNEKLEGYDYDSNESLRVDDIEVNPFLIQVLTSFQGGPQGAARGWYSKNNFIWIRKEGRQLKAEDVFDEKTAWKAALQKLVPVCEEEITDLRQWKVSEKGLTMSTRSWGCGRSNASTEDFFLPWEKLEPYLNKQVKLLP